MDMSVSVAPQQQAPANEGNASQTRPNSSGLDEWLAKIEAMGELKRISAEVDPDLEAATITYLAANEKGPALLFENIKGHPGHRALYNMIGCNLSRFCLMIGEEPVDHPLKAVQALQRKMGRTMKRQGGAGRNRDLQSEHRDRRCGRHPQISGAAHVAARRRALSRHRRCGGDAVPGDRAGQCRHLSHDDQGAARNRHLHLARQGRHARPREVVEDGQADADRGGLRHRSAAVSGGGDELSRRPKANTIITAASTARRSRYSRATSPGCRCRRAPRSSSKVSSIRTRPSPKARSASSPAITAGRPARRPICGSRRCASATIRH